MKVGTVLEGGVIDTTASVTTPEHVAFQYRTAGPGQRALAWAIDSVVKLMILFGAGLVVGVLQLIPGFGGVSQGLILLSVFFVDWFYGVALETAFNGQTLGKMAMSLRVVKTDGGPASFRDFVLRGLLKAADYVPIWQPAGVPFGVPTYLLGVGVMWVDSKQRRIGDLLAGTVVIVESRADVLGEVRVYPPVSEAERITMPPKVSLTRQERRAIEALMRRRNRLSSERVEELAELLAPSLTDRTGVEASSSERVLALAYARNTGQDREDG